jgi:hypothetical protein
MLCVLPYEMCGSITSLLDLTVEQWFKEDMHSTSYMCCDPFLHQGHCLAFSLELVYYLP